MQTDELIQTFHKNKMPENIQPMENYMRNQFPFLGLKAGRRRELARDFLKVKRAETKERADTRQPNESVIDWDLLFLLWELLEREFQLTGLDYLSRVENFLVLDDLPHLRQLVRTKSWWDTVDFLAKNIGALVQNEEALLGEMKTWSLDENIWIRRVAILHQLRYKEKTNTQLLEVIILNNIDSDEFFIQKAIGWALREYAKTDLDWVKHFTQKHKAELSSLSYREATKHF